MVDRNYDQRDLFIVPVKTLRVGDVVRDFHSADPTFGEVKRMDGNFASVHWDGDSHYHTLFFKDSSGKRCDIIRLRRKGEAIDVIGSVPPEPLSSPAHVSTSDGYSVALSTEAFAYVRNLIDIDAGESALTTETHLEVLRSFNIEF